MKKLEQYTKWVLYFIVGAALIIVYKTFDNFSSVTAAFTNFINIAMPFIIGFAIAYVLNLPCKKFAIFYKKCKPRFIHERSKGFSILTIYILVIILLIVVVRMLAPSIYKSGMDLYNNAPFYIEKTLEWLKMLTDKLGIDIVTLDNITASKAFQNFVTKIDLSEFGKYAQGVKNLTSGFVTAFISLIVSVYALVDKERIKVALKRIVTIFTRHDTGIKILIYISKINGIFSTYIYCQLMDAAIVAALATTLLAIIGVKYAIILGVMIGVCNLIPYFGAIVGWLIVSLITLFTGGLFKCLWAAVALLCLQQVDGNFIGPRIMGNMLKLRPLWIIFAVTVGGGLFGFFGLLLSVPIVVVLKMILDDFLDSRERAKFHTD